MEKLESCGDFPNLFSASDPIMEYFFLIVPRELLLFNSFIHFVVHMAVYKSDIKADEKSVFYVLLIFMKRINSFFAFGFHSIFAIFPKVQKMLLCTSIYIKKNVCLFVRDSLSPCNS
jgi:hypothetical protein